MHDLGTLQRHGDQTTLRFVVHEPAVDGDLENPAARPTQADLGARMGVQDQVRRDCTRLIASHATAFAFFCASLEVNGAPVASD